MAIPVQNASRRRIRSGPKMSENVQFWGWMYFPTKISLPSPRKLPKNPSFWGTFQCKTYYTESSMHVNRATKLKVYSYIRDLRSFEIRFEFESDVPIRFDSKVTGQFKNFELPCLPRLVSKKMSICIAHYVKTPLMRLLSYQKQHSLFNDKFQLFWHCYWDLYWV